MRHKVAFGMFFRRPTHPVSTKIALYDSFADHILVMHYPRSGGFYGLPGGHIEKHETPDDGLARELLEEVGIGAEQLVRRDFFTIEPGDNRIIVAYTGIVPAGTVVTTPSPKEGAGVWMTKQEFLAPDLPIAEAYRQFGLAHWPKA